ncbi:MAG: T9SS type A sorting domain-containing protein [Saprospiraceae bacterium]|nr:T9SS type A sorting domain-containing protein [Candidatus Defluviibacterium haderslevense]
MKNIYLALIIVLAFCINGFSQNVLTEDFNFKPVDSLENSGLWGRSGINAKYNVKVVSPGLEYMGYVGSAKGNCALVSNFGGGDIVYRNFSDPITSGSVYLSFLLKLDSLPSTFTQGYCISFNPNTGGTFLNTALHIRRLSSVNFNLGVRKTNNIDFDNSVFEINKTYLIVLKYSIIGGNDNDVSSLYAFETGVPNVEPAIPLSSTNDGPDLTGQASVYINNNYAQTGLEGCRIYIDGIRVGNSWNTSVLAVPTSVSGPTSSSNESIEIVPNPLQNSTKIKYQIPTNSHVKINIFNASGMHCSELLNEYQESGHHEFEWSSGELPNGVYSCTIQFNEYQSIKKLIVIK